MANKQDSNATGLRYAEESTLGTLPGSPVWYPLEPNSYNDFGGSIATVARNPINASRQRKKGVVTDLDAAGGFNTDLTQRNLRHLLQGYMFANMREKETTLPLNGAQVVITNVDGTTGDYEAAAGLDGFLVGHLVLAAGFSNASNNGLKRVTAVTASSLSVDESLVDETPPATAYIKAVGYQSAAGDIDVDASGDLPALTSSALDFTTLGLIPGEWIYIGGDSAGTRFSNDANNGFARIRTIAANRLELDKTDSTMVTEASTTETIQIFFGDVLKNESTAANIVRRSYQIERTLGEDDDGVMSEYLVGAVPSELTLNVRSADKVTLDLSFVATDNEQRTGADGVKVGARPSLEEATAFNTSSDFSRVRLALVTDDDSAPSPLFAFMQEFTLTLNNNLQPNKAVGTLGAFDVSAGTFEVGGQITAYFADVKAVQAVRNNSDVTLDFVMAKDNAGIVVDIGLLALGDGRANVQQDQPITLPLTLAAAANSFDHTLLWCFMDYLPDAAM